MAARASVPSPCPWKSRPNQLPDRIARRVRKSRATSSWTPIGTPVLEHRQPQSPVVRLPVTSHLPPVQQELPLESRGGQLVPRHQEDGPVFLDNSGSGHAHQPQEILVGREAKFEMGGSNPEVE